MEFVAYIAVAVIAAYVGWFARGMAMLANLSRDPDRIIKMLEQIKQINQEEDEGNTLANGGIEIEPEQVGNVWYVYAKESGQFLAQGTSLEDVLKAVADRYPEKTFWCKKTEQFNQTA